MYLHVCFFFFFRSIYEVLFLLIFYLFYNLAFIMTTLEKIHRAATG